MKPAAKMPLLFASSHDDEDVVYVLLPIQEAQIITSDTIHRSDKLDIEAQPLGDRQPILNQLLIQCFPRNSRTHKVDICTWRIKLRLLGSLFFCRAACEQHGHDSRPRRHDEQSSKR